MKFRIVETSSKDVFKDYENIKKDVLDGILVKDVKEKYGLSDGEWVKFRRELMKEGIIKSRKGRKEEAKFYYYHSAKKKWIVQRRIEGKMVSFARLDSESQCKRFVDKLTKYGWRKSNVAQIKREMGL